MCQAESFEPRGFHANPTISDLAYWSFLLFPSFEAMCSLFLLLQSILRLFLMAVEMDKYKHYNLVVPILSFCFGESFGPFTTRWRGHIGFFGDREVRDVFPSRAREVYAEDLLLPFLYTLQGHDFKGGPQWSFQALLVSRSGLYLTLLV